MGVGTIRVAINVVGRATSTISVAIRVLLRALGLV